LKTIKLYNGLRLTVDDESEDYLCFGWDEVCEAIHIPDECKDELFRYLFATGRLDLSAAYAGHTVIVEAIPSKN
jgi:hypothetical protein